MTRCWHPPTHATHATHATHLHQPTQPAIYIIERERARARASVCVRARARERETEKERDPTDNEISEGAHQGRADALRVLRAPPTM